MMDQKGIKHSSPDLLSKLPDNVIDEILMRLPFRDAVCTSILSKEWRYKWCRLPHLVLDSEFWKPKKDIEYITRDKKVWRATKDLTSNFTTTIHSVITHHPGPITKFVLCIQYWGRCPPIDNLLSFLSEKSIQHLVLRLPRQFELPCSFFTCLKLRHLLLQNCCLLLPPPDFKGFDRLISLELHDVTISSKLLESLISHGLLLEKLVLKISDTLSDIIEINAPMLRSCDFTGDMATICLKCVPRLAKLSLRHYRKDWKKFDVANFLMSNFFYSCSDLEHLHLDYTVLATGQKIPAKLNLDVPCVKHLCMYIYLGRDEILSALCLLRSFPILRYLEIQMEYNIIDHNMSALDCLEVEAFPDVMFQHLTEVKLIEANGSMRERQLIKLLLAKSPVLVRMIINSHRFLEKSAIFNRLSELTEFEVASPKAEISLN